MTGIQEFKREYLESVAATCGVPLEECSTQDK